jgi:hypothetical protein
MIPAELPDAAGSVYRARLFPWSVIRLLPDCQRSVLARFRKRNQAEEYVRSVKRVNSDWDCTIVFDPVGG